MYAKSAELTRRQLVGSVRRALTAMRPELVDRLVVIGLPHPLAWNDNMDFGQLRKSWWVLVGPMLTANRDVTHSARCGQWGGASAVVSLLQVHGGFLCTIFGRNDATGR